MAATREGMNIGSYRIIEQIGQGGMATVYKAFQPSMQRHVALKVLPQHYASDEKFVERFIREARTIARLEHKNILPVYDFGEDNGVTYIAMRYLDTGTLKDVMAEGRLTLADIADIMTQVCSALDYAHRQGVIHRDVKPANILIDSEGSAYLTDFGIAKVLEGAPGLTESGAMIGTPAYSAPEQILGKPVDARTDAYALGIVLYELVTGRVPFDAETPMAIAMAHLHDPLPLPRKIDPNIPEQVQDVIIKALAKDPDDRYQTLSALAADLRKAMLDAGVDQTKSLLHTLSNQAHHTVMERKMSMQKRPLPTLAPDVPLEKPRARRPGWLLPAAIGGGGVVIAALAVAGIVAVAGRFGGSLATTTPQLTATIRSTQVVVVPTQRPTLISTPLPTDTPIPSPTFEPTTAIPATVTLAPTATRKPTLVPTAASPLTPTPQIIFLRPSCGSTYTVQAGKPLEIRYGSWIAIGADLAAQNAQHLTVRLVLDGEPVNGVQQPVVPSSAIACTAGVADTYGVFYIARVGPLSAGTHVASVTWILDEQVTDGYDANGDGTPEAYGPGELSTRQFTIIAQ